jgi:hypothetical protein
MRRRTADCPLTPCDAVDGVALEINESPSAVFPTCSTASSRRLGWWGFLVAYQGRQTTFGQALGAAVAMDRGFLGRDSTNPRLVIAAERERRVARSASPGRTRPHDVLPTRPLNADGLDRISTPSGRRLRAGADCLLAAVIRTLTKDENDNIGAVNVVENVKAAARLTGIPWLIDAHSGKGEDQDDDADPTRAMRGASGAPGAADYLLSLRYADGAFGTHRRLSGRGRFVNLAPMVIAFDDTSSTYTVVADAGKDAAAETTWRLIREMGALTTAPQSAASLAKAIGMVDAKSNPAATTSATSERPRQAPRGAQVGGNPARRQDHPLPAGLRGAPCVTATSVHAWTVIAAHRGPTSVS